MNKKEWRKQIKELMGRLTNQEKEIQAGKVQRNLFHFDAWKKAGLIGATISVGNELDTFKIIEQAWKESKRVAVPKCIRGSRQLKFYIIESFEDIEESFYGLKEPVPERTSYVEPDQIELLLVPGLVYDRDGFRIGYGGGYYDRFLEDRNINTCSLCYDFQLTEKLPHDPFDIPVNTIITPDEIVVK